MSTPKIKDEGQEYQHVMPIMQSAGGHEIMMYDTEGDKKIIIRHASGSGIEFTNDGSIIFTAKGDIHIRSSREPSTSNNSVVKVDNDFTVEVAGQMQLKSKRAQLEGQDSFGCYSGGDLTMKGNNVVNKGKENISIESAKSVYIDTQELRERTVSRQSEIGSQEGPGGGSIAPLGGTNEINVMGNTIIRNNNPAGGITIQSAGYLNFVCGAERIDVTGNPAVAAAALTANSTAGTVNPYFAYLEGRATYTHNVYPNPGPQPAFAILPPGSAYFRTPGGYRHDCAISYNLNTLGLRLENHTGFYKRFTKGQELVTVAGPRIVIAKPLILN